MAKKLSISISDWVYEEYLSSIKVNKSKFIEEMMVKGIKTELGDYENNSAKQVQILKELKTKEEELARVKLQLSSLQNKFDRQKAKKNLGYNPLTGEVEDVSRLMKND